MSHITVVPFVHVDGSPVDITDADTVKVYVGNGQTLANVKTGSRGVQAHLSNGLPFDADKVLKAMGKGWKNMTEPGAKYLKFARAS